MSSVGTEGGGQVHTSNGGAGGIHL
jgi:hypothetical protein